MFSKESRIDELVRIILLCKKYYDDEKYPNTLEALKAYYKQNYGWSDVYKDVFERKPEEFLLKKVFKHVMNTLMEEYPDRALYFINTYVLERPPLFIDEEEWYGEYEKALFHRIVDFLNNLQIQGNGYKEINTDKYLEWESADVGYKLINPILK